MHAIIAILLLGAGILGVISYWFIYVYDALAENTPPSHDTSGPIA